MQKTKQLKIKELLLNNEAFHITRVTHETLKLPEHTHDYFEVFWVEHGSGIHHINTNKVELKPGLLTMIRSPDIHKFTSRASDPLVMVNVAFEKKTAAFISQRYLSSPNSFF